MPDEALGEIVLAFVVLAEDDVDDDELREFVGKRLSDFKIPERFQRVDEIPRTGSGKVQRHKLAELADQDESPSISS
jgi:acyl-coenzyme A synthetase/AMP-(fatty) acid ligase